MIDRKWSGLDDIDNGLAIDTCLTRYFYTHSNSTQISLDNDTALIQRSLNTHLVLIRRSLVAHMAFARQPLMTDCLRGRTAADDEEEANDLCRTLLYQNYPSISARFDGYGGLEAI